MKQKQCLTNTSTIIKHHQQKQKKQFNSSIKKLKIVDYINNLQKLKNLFQHLNINLTKIN